MHLHNVQMADNDEESERTESASETCRVEDPDSMESGLTMNKKKEGAKNMMEDIVVSQRTVVLRLMTVQMKLWQRRLNF